MALGLALEVGYAVAKGKKVFLLIDENHPNMRYWGMAKSLANHVFYINPEIKHIQLPIEAEYIARNLID